ncbi:MAG: 3',5'-cyclic-nucleotide phosphodiesterase [Azospira sp.]|jgi:ribonuclease BN (tRNA processing enzyme)|nr:3',5'-cyclic-nucleotide phosphodiesterase [Azospira sp.]
MKIQVLGCSGSIGGQHLRTTTLRVDEDVLIDAGTGVGDLTLAELARIDHVFLTHTHLDHIACLPMIADAVVDVRERPLTVHGTAEVLAILRAHLFNGLLWPDFTRLPTPESPFIRLNEIRVEEPVLIDGRSFTAIEVRHTVPAVAYVIAGAGGSLIFSGDTGSHPAFWQRASNTPGLRHLIVECAFSNAEATLAGVAGHYHPAALTGDLTAFRPASGQEVNVLITHMKPGQIDLIMKEIESGIGGHRVHMLYSDQIIEL